MKEEHVYQFRYVVIMTSKRGNDKAGDVSKVLGERKIGGAVRALVNREKLCSLHDGVLVATSWL